MGTIAQDVGFEVVRMLGLKNCYDITIHIPVKGEVEIIAKLLATEEQTEKIKETVKKYELIEKEGRNEKRTA